jgi:hypothetical protein
MSSAQSALPCLVRGPPCQLLLLQAPIGLRPLFWAAVSPVGLQVFQPGFQVIQQVDLFATLRAVHVQQLTVESVPHLSWGLPRTSQGGRGGSQLLGCW